MKYILSIFALIFTFPSIGQTPINRSEAPKAGPAPQINIGTPKSFTTANGIEVFVVENHQIPKVSVSLVLKKKPILQNQKVGYVSMSGSMMRRGTATKTKAELDEAIDFLGGHISTSSGGANASSLTKNFDKIFDLYSDVILHPAFRDSELIKVKKRTLSALESDEDDPNAILNNVVDVSNYGKDHPYGEVESPKTVKNIQIGDLKNYYQTYWKPNIAYMAFVGDITVKHAKKLVNKYLGDWKKGTVPNHEYPQPKKPQQSTIYIANRPSAVQTNIEITDPIDLKPGAKDYLAARLMNQILGGGTSGRLFQDLREKYGFTYGAYSSISYDPLVASFSASAAVRTAVTDSSLGRFMYQLNKIRDDKVSQTKLDSAKNILSGNFALSLERPSTIARFALNIARYNMPKDYYKNYLKNLSDITTNEVQMAAKKYVTPKQLNIALVGNSKDFIHSLQKYGKIQFVDIYGHPVKAPSEKKIPKGVTAKSVLSKYIQAIGGKEKLESVKDLSIRSSAEIRGMKINTSTKYLLPDKYLMSVTIPSNNQTVMETKVNGDEISMQRMGNNVPVSKQQKISIKKQAHPFYALYLLNNDSSNIELTGIEDIDGKEAYALTVTDENSNKRVLYFDKETGLKIRQMSSIKTPEGVKNSRTNVGDYKEVQGIKFPFKIDSKTGPMTIKATVDTIKINTGLTEEDFK